MLKKILYMLVTFLHLPADAVKMFMLANEISGINKKTLPTELLPLNTIQLSRGLLNFTVLQSRLNWVFPYWAEKQYNHQSLSFIPRSHLGLSMNVTGRNWTAVGNPDYDSEPIVDPRGLVTPFKDGWSIDVWLKVNDEIIFPSKSNDVEQVLINDLPIVETKITSANNSLTTCVYTYKDNLYINAEAKTEKNNSIIFSIRPFNPEGISIINNIEFDASANIFIINKKDKIAFNKKPDFVYCSTFEESDASQSLTKADSKFISYCEYGMASAIAVFKCSDKTKSVQCSYNPSLNKRMLEYHSYSESEKPWEELLQHGVKVQTPDDKINSLFKFSSATLLMLLDKESITPGPFTYHQFWIRDAVFMLNALDKLGYSGLTLPVINSFKKYQDRKGYFRSQQGEWDSNGQVLWCTYRHALITNNYKMLEPLFNSLLDGVKWIDKARLRDKKYVGKPYYGLLPAGMSAEHLGLVDYYYWDNFWSLSGLKSFAAICEFLHRSKELEYVTNLINEYQNDVDISIEKVCKENNITAVPASCTRGIDCGMIGSVSAVYPLQLFSTENQRMQATLDDIYGKYFYKGMFFQNFIHSGMNTYLTLHVAHAYLYSGNRERFWEILSSVISNSTSTLTYPEAIHPFTGGGAMGDGHHGWAAAEIVMALRDAFIYENFKSSVEFEEFILLSGIPGCWFEQRVPFSIKDVPIPSGKISINVIPSELTVKINISFIQKGYNSRNAVFKIELPFEIESAEKDGKAVSFTGDDKTFLIVPQDVKEITIWRKLNADYTASNSKASSAIKSL